MRLRRLEFAIIGITLAFACFIGGFFTGRSWSAVNITAVAAQSENSVGVGLTITAPDTQQQPPPAHTNTGEHGSGGLQVQPVNPGEGNSSELAGSPRGGDGKININTASQSELMDLPGIGSVLASRIIDYRKQHGNFSGIEDIRNVTGIGEKRYEAIQGKITVG
jgi:competence protein ComEA